MIRPTSKTDMRLRWLREYQRARNSGRRAGQATLRAYHRMYRRPVGCWHALGMVRDDRTMIQCALERRVEAQSDPRSVYWSIIKGMRNDAAHRASMRRVARLPEPWR